MTSRASAWWCAFLRHTSRSWATDPSLRGVISKQMVQVLAQVRKWLVAGVCVLLAVVLLSYWIARSRIKPVLHSIPQQLGIDIQQTSEGFSLSKSEGGKTLYTIRASKAV